LLPFCGGIEVIHTPGHTPGHICLLLKGSNVLITGDAANASNGIMTGPNPQHTLDMTQGEASFKRLMGLKPDFIVCYHGGLCAIK
jgi:glyoxylase-like metal-dependent hydrolase (beta-lactamase superfamily II)